ncbi:MAG: SDR family oxidoreductase [Chloroflexota bacterium]
MSMTPKGEITMILVTGATGAVGRELRACLVGQGQAVRAMSRTPEKAHALLGAKVDVVRGDFHDPVNRWASWRRRWGSNSRPSISRLSRCARP